MLSFVLFFRVGLITLKYACDGLFLIHVPMSYRLVQLRAEAKKIYEEREEVERQKAEEIARRKEVLAALLKEWTVDGHERIPAALVTGGDPAVVVADRMKRTFVLVPCALAWQHGAQAWVMALPPQGQGTGHCSQILPVCKTHDWPICLIILGDLF